MAATAFLSLWISNTASTMVAAPIAASIAAMRGRDDGFGAALMLSVAYAATIGGMGSLIGTPPNALFAAYMEETHGIVIGFAEWMLVGLPVVIVLLPLTWVLLTHAAFRIGPEPITLDFSGTTPLSKGEKRLAAVAGLTALGWITRPLVSEAFPDFALSDAGIAMTGALALFIIVYLGKLASNTAMAAIFLPVAGAAAIGIGADPLIFALPVAMAASIGFMLPVATPPNAIVFANPLVTRPDMLRAGAPLDLIGIVVALAAGMVLGPLVF